MRGYHIAGRDFDMLSGEGRMIPKLILALVCGTGLGWGQDLGIFSGQTDVGAVARAGAASFDAVANRYTVSGAGENMWGESDAFHFVWKKMSGDAAIGAEIEFAGEGGNAHRKAVLMIRQSLAPGAAYADAAVHGDGLVSLQARETAGGRTWESGIERAGARRVRLEKRGDSFHLYVAREGEPLRPAGPSLRVALRGEFYIGIGVCAHDKAGYETARFAGVRVGTPERAPSPVLYSTLETVSIGSADRRVVRVFASRIEAPNWMADGTLLINGGGRLLRVPPGGGEPVAVETGSARKINNDHGVSPDGKRIAISDSSEEGKSVIYTLPAEGGTPKRVTPKAPSYWHGWSPDGRTLTFCGQREGQFDIYTIPVEGGEETRLTHGEGHNDGPEYSPDGKWIYFNSSRTGRMQVWRMRPDGSGLEQMTGDEANNWFPHLSPDGKWMVFLSYGKEVTGHPANQEVSLRVMHLADRQVRPLARLFGGQGTINVPSWSPDSKRVAFVSYQLLP